jgi:hypothetical protein
MTGKQVTGYDRSSLLGKAEALRSSASFRCRWSTKGHDLSKMAVSSALSSFLCSEFSVPEKQRAKKNPADIADVAGLYVSKRVWGA